MTDLFLNRSDYQDLKSHYDKAVEAKLDTFEWRGRKILVTYAKYLLEYLNLELSKP